MNVVELCEPIFQEICKVNRIGRNRGHLEYSALREDIKQLLGEIEARSQGDPVLHLQYGKVKLPLLFFIDSMIVESRVSCARDWDENRLAYEHDELAGDEAFFDHLDRAMAETSPESSDVLAFYYVCLGLGFTGFYYGQPEFIRQKMNELVPRIRTYLKSDFHDRIIPDAYRHTNTANLVQPPAPRLWGILVAFAGVAVAVFFTVVYLYFSASNDLARSITTIEGKRTLMIDQ